jgi:uncharacterized membrane protein YoaT (DUF817 family)
MEDTFEPTVSNVIHLVGVCIEIFGVFIIVAGIVWSYFSFHVSTKFGAPLRSL